MKRRGGSATITILTIRMVTPLAAVVALVAAAVARTVEEAMAAVLASTLAVRWSVQPSVEPSEAPVAPRLGQFSEGLSERPGLGNVGEFRISMCTS